MGATAIEEPFVSTLGGFQKCKKNGIDWMASFIPNPPWNGKKKLKKLW